MLEPLPPLFTAELFAPLHDELIRLLRGLSEADWNRPTVAGAWRVRDVAGHLLDGDLRKLSGGRDGYASSRPASPSFVDITAFINDLNASGVGFSQRLSARVMTDLLDATGRWVSEHVLALPPHEPARISVLWAGEEQSANWMDTGREYTERWHHQMQIRDAIGATRLLDARWFFPLLDLSVRAFPRAFRDQQAAVGATVAFEVVGDETWRWTLVRESSGWTVRRGADTNASAIVRADPDTAWKLLYNALPGDVAQQRLNVVGDRALALPLLGARSVMV